MMPRVEPVPPHPHQVDDVAAKLVRAKCPIVLACRGVMRSGADLAAVAQGFGLRGANVTDIGQLRPLFDAYQTHDAAEVWNIHISDKVVSPNTRRGTRRGHGKV